MGNAQDVDGKSLPLLLAMLSITVSLGKQSLIDSA
jgi:hypothetical protein